MKRYRGFIWVLLIVIALIIVKIVFFKNTASSPATANKKQANTVPSVSAMIIHPQPMSNIALVSGSLLSNESVNLQPQASGMITGLFFKEGDFIKQGTLMVKINDADLQAQLQKEQATLDINQNDLAREEKLYKLNAVNEDDYNTAVLNVKSAEADMASTQAQIGYTEIRAPFDGQVGVRNISPGAFVSSSTVIATFYQSNPIKVEFDLPEKYASQISMGANINFTIQGNSKKYSAKVYVINPGITELTRTLTVRALCENDGSLRDGSFANIIVDLGSKENALLIPTQALIPVLTGEQIFVTHNDSAFSVPVQTGLRNDTSIEITEGLKSGDTVITSGILFLHNKMKIHLQKVH
jgi:membrane fusion protein, multidrug efflux system